MLTDDQLNKRIAEISGEHEDNFCQSFDRMIDLFQSMSIDEVATFDRKFRTAYPNPAWVIRYASARDLADIYLQFKEHGKIHGDLS